MKYSDKEKINNIINLLDFAKKNTKNLKGQFYVKSFDENIEKQKDEQQTKKLEEINETAIPTIRNNGISL